MHGQHANTMYQHPAAAMPVTMSTELQNETSNAQAKDGEAPSFTLFPKLAVELQIMIWKYSCTPQLLKINGKRNDRNRPLFDGVVNKSRVPPTLHVCRVSSGFALKIYLLIEGDINLVWRPMHYNRFEDIILLENVRCMGILLRKPLWVQAPGKQERRQVLFGHIAVTMEWPFGYRAGGPSRNRHTQGVFGEFSSLCERIFSNNSAFATSQHITLVKTDPKAHPAVRGPPSQITFPFAPPKSHVGSQRSWAIGTIQILRRNGVRDCQGYLNALMLRATIIERKLRKTGAERLETRQITLTCCTLEELMGGNPMGCKEQL